jgi:hypothetical protein
MFKLIKVVLELCHVLVYVVCENFIHEIYISYLHNGNNQRRSDASLHDFFDCSHYANDMSDYDSNHPLYSVKNEKNTRENER